MEATGGKEEEQGAEQAPVPAQEQEASAGGGGAIRLTRRLCSVLSHFVIRRVDIIIFVSVIDSWP